MSRCDSLSRVTVTFVLRRFLSYVVRGSTRVVQLVISSLCVSLGDVSLGFIRRGTNVSHTFLRSTDPIEKVKRLISHLFAIVSQVTTASMLNCAGAATRVRPSVVGLYFAPAVGTKQTRYSTTCDHNRRCNVNVKQT